jgi:hypothetical protein
LAQSSTPRRRASRVTHPPFDGSPLPRPSRIFLWQHRIRGVRCRSRSGDVN